MKKISLALPVVLILTACSASKPTVVEASSDQTAPATYRVNFDTSRGPFVIEVTRDLAPHGADHFYTLVKAKYFDGARFYRVVPGFMVKWGSAADPKVSEAWDKNIPDDPVKGTNARGTISFAATGQPDSRSTHMFINFADNGRLDAMGFAPIGKVVSGMENVDQIYSGDGGASRSEPHEGRRQRLSAARIPQSRLHQDRPHRPVKRCGC